MALRNSGSSSLDAETPTESSRSMTRWSLRWVLGLAVATLLAVLFVGMRFAQQGTSRAGDLVGAVETRYAPLLRMARDLREAITAFDRTVVGLPAAVSPNELAELRSAGSRMLQVYDEYARLAPPRPADSRLDLRDRKPQYLRHMPRVWGYLQRSLSHPALEALNAWYIAHVPSLNSV